MAGFYERRVFPWLLDRLTTSHTFADLRREALAPARGRVVEIGFGTGASLAAYPPAVSIVLGVDPNPGVHRRAAAKTAGSPHRCLGLMAAAEALPLRDACADTVVSVLTLCSVCDPAASLRELRRIVRAEGQLLLLEHGLAPDARVAAWQRRLDPIEAIVACGCHLTRPVIALVEGAGFRIERSKARYVPGLPRTHGWITTGLARPI